MSGQKCRQRYDISNETGKVALDMFAQDIMSNPKFLQNRKQLNNQNLNLTDEQYSAEILDILHDIVPRL